MANAESFFLRFQIDPGGFVTTALQTLQSCAFFC